MAIEPKTTRENIPDINNPFKNLPKPDLGPVSQLPPVITGADANVVAQNAKYGSVPFTALPQDQKEAAIDRLFD